LLGYFKEDCCHALNGLRFEPNFCSPSVIDLVEQEAGSEKIPLQRDEL